MSESEQPATPESDVAFGEQGAQLTYGSYLNLPQRARRPAPRVGPAGPGRYAAAWAVGEALLQHDELAASWRARHVVMVERMIGDRSGTGGSSGSAYLRSRLDLRYYPLLWELRSGL